MALTDKQILQFWHRLSAQERSAIERMATNQNHVSSPRPSRDVSSSGDTARFWSGDLEIRLRLRGDSESYSTTIYKDGKRLWSGVINAPRAGFGRHAYDSRYAYQKTAQAALSFAENDKPGLADVASYGAKGYVLRTWQRKR